MGEFSHTLHYLSYESDTGCGILEAFSFLQSSRGGVYKRIWDKVIRNKEKSLCYPNNECNDRMMDSDYYAKIGMYNPL